MCKAILNPYNNNKSLGKLNHYYILAIFKQLFFLHTNKSLIVVGTGSRIKISGIRFA